MPSPNEYKHLTQQHHSHTTASTSHSPRCEQNYSHRVAHHPERALHTPVEQGLLNSTKPPLRGIRRITGPLLVEIRCLNSPISHSRLFTSGKPSDRSSGWKPSTFSLIQSRKSRLGERTEPIARRVPFAGEPTSYKPSGRADGTMRSEIREVMPLLDKPSGSPVKVALYTKKK